VIDLFVYLAGYTVAVFSGGRFVQWALEQTLSVEDLQTIESFRNRGLREGGKLIGWLERFLFLSFLLAGQYSALGFVMATKGIVRYGEIKEAKDQKVAEYVLIGTMLSVAWTLAVFALVRGLVR
jgi:hypothetical protein